MWESIGLVFRPEHGRKLLRNPRYYTGDFDNVHELWSTGLCDMCSTKVRYVSHLNTGLFLHFRHLLVPNQLRSARSILGIPRICEPIGCWLLISHGSLDLQASIPQDKPHIAKVLRSSKAHAWDALVPRKSKLTDKHGENNKCDWICQFRSKWIHGRPINDLE